MNKNALLCVLTILCSFGSTLFSQNNNSLTITGTVRNTAGEPLANATVTVLKTNRGTITNAKGSFTLSHLNPKDQLRISLIGYAAQTVTINNSDPLTITLKEANNELDRVVVQAYGTTSDRLRTGNISKITSEQIEKQPVMNVLNVLQGQVPGLDVSNTNGFSAAPIKIEVRGRNLINPAFSSDPLFVIDGVPLTIQDMHGKDSYEGGSMGVSQGGFSTPTNGQSPFFNINPNDIESIEVLKDADATAIYGSRGAKGVILITTKMGKSGKLNMELNASSGFSAIIKSYDLLSTMQYVAMRREALENDGLALNVVNAPDLVVWDTTRYTNWQKVLMDGGQSVVANFTISGGNELSTFRLSADYTRNKDLSTYSGANQRASVSNNISLQSPSRRLSIAMSSFFTATKTNPLSMPYLMDLPPNAPSIWDGNGNPNFNGWAPLDNLYRFGGLANFYNSNTKMLNSNLNIRYELFKGVQLKTSGGFGNIQSNQTLLVPIRAQNPKVNPKGSGTHSITGVTNFIIEPQLEYNRFLGKGKLNALIGGSWQNNKTSYNRAVGTGYTNDALLSSVNNAPVRNAANGTGIYHYAALFGRLGYNLMEKYLINLNGRRDGSSKFGPGRQFGNFGSIGMAWIFSEEAWMRKGIPIISFGKLRASHGASGGDDIGNYQFLSRWAFGAPDNSYNGILPLNPLSHLDSLIQWQVNYKTELALTIGVLNDRLTIDVSWYKNRCNNQLVQFPTPLYTGFGSVLTNSPANVENKGWELVAKAKAVQTKNWGWDINFNISRNRNRLISYPNFSESPYYLRAELGKPLSIQRVLHYTGINPLTGNYDFEDKNGSGNIENNKAREDDTYWLDITPDFFGGISNNIRWKGWRFSCLFYFKKQINRSVLASTGYPGGIKNQPSSILSRWQHPGDISSTPRFSTKPPSVELTRFLNSDGIWTDASYIRLQNISLSYQLPESFCKKIKIVDCNFFFRGQNLFVMTKYDGLDPEVTAFHAPPLPRILTGGVTLKF